MFPILHPRYNFSSGWVYFLLQEIWLAKNNYKALTLLGNLVVSDTKLVAYLVPMTRRTLYEKLIYNYLNIGIPYRLSCYCIQQLVIMELLHVKGNCWI